MLILFIVLTCFLLLKHPLIPRIFRTGLLGFLSDETRELPGNLGLTDVALALDWVQQAVADFGGNPGSVTLAGWGQGAVIAHLLSLNPTTASRCHLSEIMLGITCVCNFRPVPQADPAEWKLPVQGQCVPPLHGHPGPAVPVLCLQVGELLLFSCG